jgi:hypothetical protein
MGKAYSLHGAKRKVYKSLVRKHEEKMWDIYEYMAG